MRLQINRERRLILLNWLKQGYIDTLDIPEAYKDSTLLKEFLMESSAEETAANEKAGITEEQRRDSAPIG